MKGLRNLPATNGQGHMQPGTWPVSVTNLECVFFTKPVEWNACANWPLMKAHSTKSGTQNPFNQSTIQLFNHLTIQPFNHSTI